VTWAAPGSRFRTNLCTFSRNRASFFQSSRPGKAGVQAKTRDQFEAELARLN
jgi:hypothetical protein